MNDSHYKLAMMACKNKNKNLCIYFLDTAEEIMQEIGRSFKIYQ